MGVNKRRCAESKDVTPCHECSCEIEPDAQEHSSDELLGVKGISKCWVCMIESAGKIIVRNSLKKAFILLLGAV